MDTNIHPNYPHVQSLLRFREYYFSATGKSFRDSAELVRRNQWLQVLSSSVSWL